MTFVKLRLQYLGNMENIYYGTELKLSVSVEPISGFTMDNYDFSVDIYTNTPKVVSLPKAELIRVDKDTYVACVDTTKIGSGRVRCRVSAYIPDGDFKDGKRNEVCIVDTGINIIG